LRTVGRDNWSRPFESNIVFSEGVADLLFLALLFLFHEHFELFHLFPMLGSAAGKHNLKTAAEEWEYLFDFRVRQRM